MHPRADTVRRRYNLHLIDYLDCMGTETEVPTLDPCHVIPDRLRTFTSCARCTDHAAGVHFFLDDYRFEWAWSDPLRYVDMLRRFECVLTPDFSCYVDMPEPMQRWNVYRGRAVGRIWQKHGLNVIPTLTWGFEDTYGFCFDGIPTGSVVALSTVGLMRGRDAQRLFVDGASEAARRLEPSALLAYGKQLDFDAAGAE
ncbi:MAG: DUF4417 domain-containing protein, partial [Coriobacteriales bacterium]|nr:DUF4417 domain-containing protein [Coriobacteriales bacterium]